MNTNPSDIDIELDDAPCFLGGSNLPPEFFLRMQDDFKEEDADDTAYADGTTRQLDAIERRWNTYVSSLVLFYLLFFLFLFCNTTNIS